MKKNVGIMSMQRIRNYGSYLQAYGLKCILEELGCEVQFVDYHLGNTLLQSDKGIKRIYTKVVDIWKIKTSLKNKIKYISHKKNFKKKYWSDLGISDEMNYNPQVDMLIIGSDEVFNCVQSNPNVGFSPELFGVDAKAKRIISYAASFGNTTMKQIKKYDIDDKIARWINAFDAVSVRDTNSGKIIETINGFTPEYHMDPVIVFDYMTKCSRYIENTFDDNYIILYAYSGRMTKQECKKIEEFAKKRLWKVFCIGGIQDVCDSFIDCDPFQVIGYFANAKCIITDTFHGTIMSIIAHKPFVTFVREEGYGNSEKLVDLLERLHLRDREIDNIEDLGEKLEKEIDYMYVDRIVQYERERSYDYLKREINRIGESK